MSHSIYIIEDDESIRELIKIALISFSYEVRAFENAEDALEAIRQQPPDIAIFDIMLPGMSGLEAVKLLRAAERTKKLHIVLLTAKSTEYDKVVGLDCGADDYITKPFGVMELGARIRSIFRRLGQDAGAPQMIYTRHLTLNTDTREVTQDGQRLDLTFKEYELLSILVRKADRIVSREELLNTVWGFDFLGESRTLDMHIRTLRQKLGDDAEHPRFIKTVRRVGYRFIDGDSRGERAGASGQEQSI